ncbi:MAG: hypothetical protein RO469_15915 [Thermincola sp.]|nr:hypothetical protein [Thermincola sp.]MDT3704517.1 hypothetical protein [Thermincola sp.]
MKAPPEPDFDGDVNLLLKYTRFKDPEDQLLYLVYLISCFVPSIPHPILVVHGEKGAAKSTTLRMTRLLVDPVGKELQIMPNNIQDLAITLSNNYMPCFDNMDRLSAEKSDMICVASTGGWYSKRALYTDDEEANLYLKCCVAMNGINVVATRPDLLDRSIILELARIDESERKEERAIWSDFEAARPKILGGILSTLSRAMAIYQTVELDSLSRMADFSRWGYAISEALGFSGKKFLDAYRNNQLRANEEAISSHPVAAAVIALVKTRTEWNGTVAELLDVLDEVAEKERINTNAKVSGCPCADQTLEGGRVQPKAGGHHLFHPARRQG